MQTAGVLRGDRARFQLFGDVSAMDTGNDALKSNLPHANFSNLERRR